MIEEIQQYLGGGQRLTAVGREVRVGTGADLGYDPHGPTEGEHSWERKEGEGWGDLAGARRSMEEPNFRPPKRHRLH